MKTRALLFAPLAAVAVSLVSCETYDYRTDYAPVVYEPGYEVDTIPTRYTNVSIDGSPYYYSRGNYYTLRNNRYVVVDPPIRKTRSKPLHQYGHYVDAMPSGYQTINYRKRDYYYHNGNYYRTIGNRYKVVRSPYNRY